MPSTGTTTSDHPIFRRLSRDQLVARRRNIGYQTLTFQPTGPRTSRCKQCGRPFNSVWKEYLCHVCGLWVCLPCSFVLERERELQYITFMRSCVSCQSMLTKWSDADQLTEFVSLPWVVASSKRQLSLTLSDTLRTKQESRRSVLTVLKYLGRPVDPAASFLDTIQEADWVSAMTECVVGTSRDSVETESSMTSTERVQHLIQQCFEVNIPDMALEDCVFAEADGTRHYPLLYIDPDEPPNPPVLQSEADLQGAITKYGLLQGHLNTPTMQLICDLANKEFDGWNAFVSLVNDDMQTVAACSPGCPCGLMLKRSESFCGYAFASPLPFLVRDASLDIRFRNFETVRGSNIRFYVAFPIIVDTGKTAALLCVLDTKPRKVLTTMQYAVMKRLAAVVSGIIRDLDTSIATK